MSKEINHKLEKLQKKYSSIGQDMNSYLEGLLYTNPLSYWDYINLETLLSLQRPKTDFPDEEIFIVYHQITELYFKLIIKEITTICNNGKVVSDIGEDKGWGKTLSINDFIKHLKRINNYFKALISSFDIMIEGMERSQFLKFRMSLLPASGFQSYQYRIIELMSTDLINLVEKKYRKKQSKSSDLDKFKKIYWMKGSVELNTGKKTLMLKNFEKKYLNLFIKTSQNYKKNNLFKKYKSLKKKDQKNKALIDQLKLYDLNVNVEWPLVHYKSAVKYLSMPDKDIIATGGTNWKKYMPPKFQKTIFFPNLWTETEKENWGKNWVLSNFK